MAKTAAELHEQFLAEQGVNLPKRTEGRGDELRFFRLSPRATCDIQAIESSLGETVRPVPWLPSFYCVSGTCSLSSSAAYRNGDIYGIDASSGAAVLALDPQPGETILDLCCAPGGKLCFIADLVENTSGEGLTVGVDVSPARLAVCDKVIQKYRVPRVRTCLADGRLFDGETDLRCTAASNIDELRARQRVEETLEENSALPLASDDVSEIPDCKKKRQLPSCSMKEKRGQKRRRSQRILKEAQALVTAAVATGNALDPDSIVPGAVATGNALDLDSIVPGATGNALDPDSIVPGAVATGSTLDPDTISTGGGLLSSRGQYDFSNRSGVCGCSHGTGCGVAGGCGGGRNDSVGNSGGTGGGSGHCDDEIGNRCCGNACRTGSSSGPADDVAVGITGSGRGDPGVRNVRGTGERFVSGSNNSCSNGSSAGGSNALVEGAKTNRRIESGQSSNVARQLHRRAGSTAGALSEMNDGEGTLIPGEAGDVRHGSGSGFEGTPSKSSGVECPGRAEVECPEPERATQCAMRSESSFEDIPIGVECPGR
eukprot:Rmarinus@m.29333